MYIPELNVNGVKVPRPNSEQELGLETLNNNKVPVFFDKQLNLINEHIKTIDPSINWERYENYRIVPHPFVTDYDVKKLAAKYQSNWEKAGRSLFQGIYNEAIIGTLKGFMDIIDVTIAGLSKNKTVGEFTNPVTKMLEEYQEQIRYNREIFKQNPEKTFDFGDFGWWADGFVNVATTLSLLIPSKALSSGLSLIPRAIVKGMYKAGKANRSFSLVGNAIMKSDKARKLAALKGVDINNTIRGIDGFNDILTTAFFSRTLENRQEARENFKMVKESALRELANMSDEERANFYARNKDRGYSDEMGDDKIASDIANISSGEVFKNDYWMLLMDIAQYAGINKLLSNKMFGKVAGKNMKIENEILKKSLTKSAQQYYDDIARRSATRASDVKPKGFKAKLADIKQNGVDKIILGNSLIFGFEAVSEGFEEVFQGIQNARGMNIADRILDPEVTERTLNSYLNDPTIWEQGFWGMIGGALFQAAGAAINKMSKEKFIRDNKDRLTDQQITEIRYGINRQQLEDLKRRMFATERLYSNLNDIENGLNPFRFKTDNEGNVIKIDGNPVKEEIDDIQAEILKNKVLDNYLADLYYSSYRSGTTPLLREFINSPEFTNAMMENTHGMGNNTIEFNKNLNKRFNQIASKFDELVYRIGVGENIKNPFALEAYAKQILNDIMRGEQDGVLVNYFQNLINMEMTDSNSNFTEFELSGYENAVISRIMGNKLAVLSNKIRQVREMAERGEISQTAARYKIAEYNRIINRFSNIIAYGKIFGFDEEADSRLKDLYGMLENEDNFTEFLSVLHNNTLGVVYPDNNKIKRYVELKAAALIDKYYTDAQIPNLASTREIQEGYEEFSYMLDKYVKDREDNALKVMEDVIKNSNDPKQALNDILNEDYHNDEVLEDAAEVLMLGKRVTITDKGNVTQDPRILYLMQLAQERQNDIDRGGRNNNENSVPTVEQQDEDVIDELEEEPEVIEEESEESVEPINPTSTGEETRSVEEPIIDIHGEEDIDPFMDDVIIEPDPTDTQQDGDVFISETEIMDANARKNVSEYIRKLIFDTFKNNINLFKEMVKNGYTKSKAFIDFYNDIIVRVKDYMTLNGYNIDNLSIQQEIATYINLVGQSASIAQRDDIKSLGKDILTLHKELIKPDVIAAIDKIMSNFSTIAGVETNELDKVFETFYEEYVKQNGIIIRKNNANETLIDIESILNYIVFNDALTEEEKRLLVQNLITFGENVNGFRFVNTIKTYNKYKSSPQTLINKIKQNRRAKDLSLIEDKNTMRIEGALNTLAITTENARSCYDNDTIKDPNVASAINILERRYNHTKKEIDDANEIIKQYINNFVVKNINNDKYRLGFTTDDNNTIYVSLIDRATGKTIVNNIGFLTSIEGDGTNNRFGIKPEIFRIADLINNHGFLWSIEEVANGTQISYIDSQIDNYFMQLINAATNVNVMTNPQTAAEKLLAMLLSRNKTDNTDNIYFDPKNPNDQQEVIDFLTNDLIKYLGVGAGLVGRFGCRIQIGGMYRNVKLNTAAGGLSIEYFDSKGNITISTNTVDLIKVANVILSQTNHILFHSLNESKDGSGNISKDVLEASYNNFKKKAYQNYKRQYEFANAIRKNGDVDASFTRYEREYFNFLKNTDVAEPLSPSELDRTLNSTDNPIVRSNGIYDIIIEGIEEPVELYNFDRYESDMGILLTNPQKERPIVAWITNENMRDLQVADTETHSYDINRRKLGEAIKGEINKILQEYENSDKTDEDFEKIYKAISQLVGGANTSRKGLFSGVDVFYSKKATGSAISIVLNNQPIGDKKLKDVADIVILKDDNKFKDGLVLYKQNDGKRKGKVISKEIDTLTNVLFKSIRFNKSFYMFANSKIETDTESTNPYYRKKDGKLNITIGSYNKSYDSYSQFLYVNNAFKLPLKLNDDGSIRTIRELNDRTPSFVIQYDFNSTPSSPVEKTVHIYNEDAIKELIEQREEDGKINTTKLLTNTNIDKRYLQFLFGDNVHNVKLLDSDIYYEETPPKNSKGKVIINGMYYGRYDSKTGRIYLAKSGLEYILNIGNNNEFDSYNETLREDLITNKKSTELQRIVLHENLHKRIDESSAIKNDETVDGLINTLISAVESLATSEHSRKKVIENWLNKFIVINDGKLDLDATIERFAKEKGVKVDKRYIAEEWIVEVLSNQALIDYLANTKYTLNGKEIEVAEVKDKSIFQKIIDILLEIFGINLENTEKNSIFAEQYRLLNADNTITTNTVKRTRTNKKGKETTKKQKGKKPKVKTTGQLQITFGETGTGETGTGNESSEVKTHVNEANETIEDILASIATDENSGITNEPNLDDLPGMFSTVDGIFTEEEIILNNYKQNGDINAYGIISAPNVNSFLAMFPIEEQPLIAENIKNGGVKYLC